MSVLDKAHKMSVLWLALGIFSIASAIVGTVLLAWFALSGWYVASVIVGIFTAHGYYGIPIYFRLYALTLREISCVRAVCDNGDMDITSVGDRVGLDLSEVKKRLLSAVRHGYAEGEILVRIESILAKTDNQ